MIYFQLLEKLFLKGCFHQLLLLRLTISESGIDLMVWIHPDVLIGRLLP